VADAASGAGPAAVRVHPDLEDADLAVDGPGDRIGRTERRAGLVQQGDEQRERGLPVALAELLIGQTGLAHHPRQPRDG